MPSLSGSVHAFDVAYGSNAVNVAPSLLNAIDATPEASSEAASVSVTDCDAVIGAFALICTVPVGAMLSNTRAVPEVTLLPSGVVSVTLAAPDPFAATRAVNCCRPLTTTSVAGTPSTVSDDPSRKSVPLSVTTPPAAGA